MAGPESGGRGQDAGPQASGSHRLLADCALSDLSSHPTEFPAASHHAFQGDRAIATKPFFRGACQLPDRPRHAHRVVRITTYVHSKRRGHRASSDRIRTPAPRVVFRDAVARRHGREGGKKRAIRTPQNADRKVSRVRRHPFSTGEGSVRGGRPHRARKKPPLRMALCRFGIGGYALRLRRR
jgi:hypothetical protein